MREHEFTPVIKNILNRIFGGASEDILVRSELLQYLNTKTVSASRGSKARGAFGNIYAIYVLVEDYINRKFHESGNYRDAAGAKFSELLTRQRQLPFGSKLQNHALNHRMNQEFRKYFPTSEFIPILRDPETNRYWINENLLKVKINFSEYNIAEAIIDIIDAYVEAKQGSFNSFIRDCRRMQEIYKQSPDEVINFVHNLLRPNVDARIFEIVSFAILKAYYEDISIFWGWNIQEIGEEKLILYKTGRTNANDGGIDFVMRPLGRFFQVTETLNIKKYFLDIDKIHRYPITFVVKTKLDIDEIKESIRRSAEVQYSVNAIVERYMQSIEEVINIPTLMERLQEIIDRNGLNEVIDEIVKHSQVEFNLKFQPSPAIDTQIRY